MQLIKEVIKEKAALQPVYKNQRKTVHLQGERTLSPLVATSEHSNNRYYLRLLYAAYAILRGKDPVIAAGPIDAWDKIQIDKLVAEYAAAFEAVRVSE